MIKQIEYVDIYLHGNSISDNILIQKLELFVQEIELAVQIGPNEIWGINESINLNRFLFNQYVTVTQIRNEISNFIAKNCYHASDFTYNISVETLKNSGTNDLIYIVCSVNAEDQNGNPQTYPLKFLLGT